MKRADSVRRISPLFLGEVTRLAATLRLPLAARPYFIASCLLPLAPFCPALSKTGISLLANRSERRTLYRQFKTFAVHLTLRCFFLVLVLQSSVLRGQSFQPLPAPLVTQEVALNQANEVYLHFDNPSGDTLRLKWRQLEISMPEGWDIDLCDYGTCYIGIPYNGTMNAVYDTIQPYLKLIVQPGATPGAAWCWFRVQEVGHPENFQDVYFSLYTAGITATQTTDPSAFHIYPNPARDFLILENPSQLAQPGRLFDRTGRLVWQENIPPASRTRIPLTNWPAGLYFLQIGSETRQVVVEK